LSEPALQERSLARNWRDQVAAWRFLTEDQKASRKLVAAVLPQKL
jgi:hypothetical protein